MHGKYSHVLLHIDDQKCKLKVKHFNNNNNKQSRAKNAKFQGLGGL